MGHKVSLGAWPFAAHSVILGMRSHRTLSLVLLLTAGTLSAQEICNNGIDDDGNGAIDLNDPACLCAGSVGGEVPSLIPNGSLEERQTDGNGNTCCPFAYVSIGTPWLTCAIGWAQPTQGTTDYMHHCGYMPELVVPQPVPDGEGCVGTIGMPGYFEYLGHHLPASLTAGTSYTLQFQFAATSMTQTAGPENEMYSAGVYYDPPVPLSVFGHADMIAFPVNTFDCIADQDGWVELATIQVQGVPAWQPLSIPFTPGFDVHTLLIGPSCGLSADFEAREITIPNGGSPLTLEFVPYFVYDDLVLNTSDLLPEGISIGGAWCTSDVVLTAALPDGAADGQWYRDGIALAGQTAATLDLNAAGLDGGRYSYTGTAMGSCFRSDREVPYRPAFSMVPPSGPAPLTVTFTATTPGTAEWNLGDGTLAQGGTIEHVYTEPGTYTVTLTQIVLGCATTTTIIAAVEVAAQQLQIIATPQPTDITNTEITLTGQGPEGITGWAWDLGAVEPFTAEGQQIVVQFPAIAGTYPISLVATGDFRDEDSDTTYYTVVVLEALGVNELSSWAPLNVQPNPVQGIVTVDPGHLIDRWEVLNTLGQSVLQGGGPLSLLTFDSAPLRSGTYQLRIEGAGTVRVARFTKH